MTAQRKDAYTGQDRGQFGASGEREDPLVELARIVSGETRDLNSDIGSDLNIDLEDALFQEINADLPALDDLGMDLDENEPAPVAAAAPVSRPAEPVRTRIEPDFDSGSDPAPVDLDELAGRAALEDDDPRHLGEEGVLPEHDPDPEDAPAPRRGLKIVAVVLGLVVLGIGAVVLTGLFSGTETTGAPRIVRAPQEPVRVAAETLETGEPRPGQAVYDRLEGQGGAQETGTPRVVLPGPGAPVATPATTPAANTAPAASEPAAPTTPVAGARPVAPPSPRQVRTVTVRPDGTVVEVTAEPETAAAAPTPAPVQPLPPAPETPVTVASAPPAPEPAPTPAPAPVVPAATAPAAAVTPAPAPAAPAPARPVAAAPAPVAAPQNLAPQPAATPAPAPQVAATQGGGFVVQLASLRSEEQARDTFANLQRRFSGELSGETPDIRRVDLAERGIYYRLRIGPMTRETANQRCERLRSLGGDCIVQRF
ncbi:MAG: SPOR domain-containing protein [Hyphomicrobiaceae bacterium]|nr:SPOR domain-containing protein [Hyphomicrobiaceae bacterium]